MKQNGWIEIVVLVILGWIALAAIYYGLTHLNTSSQIPQSSPAPVVTTTPISTTKPTQKSIATAFPTATPTDTLSTPQSSATSSPTATNTTTPKGKKILAHLFILEAKSYLNLETQVTSAPTIIWF